MRIVVIDVETTGLDEDKDFVWQLSYVVAEVDGNRLVIKEHGENVFLRAIFRRRGKMHQIEKKIKSADLVVGHNVNFERKFLRRYGIEISRKKSYCTMLNSKDLCRIKHPYFGYKWPKLSEAVEMLLKHEVDKDKLHDASYDVMLTVKLYAYLNNLQIDDSSYKKKTANKLLKNLLANLLSPLEPYTSRREEILSPLREKIKRLKSVKNIFKRNVDDDIPF